jgi:DHA1 family tetracycline resistance protein-like MFS transporter
MTAAGRAPRSQGPRLAIIVAVVIIDVLGIGLMLPVLPVLIRELSGGDLPSASSIYGWIVALYSLMQFLFGPMLGALSDRFGRRPVILFSLAGLVVDYVILALAPNVWWVAAARILGGIMGASITTASAYIADISPPEKRAQNFGLIGVGFGVGFVAGPFLGGFLGEIGSRVPFWAAAGVALLGLFFAYFFLPELLVPANRKRFRLTEGNPVGAFVVLARYPLALRQVASAIGRAANVSEVQSVLELGAYGVAGYAESRAEANARDGRESIQQGVQILQVVGGRSPP